jgi:hypothetical protein
MLHGEIGWESLSSAVPIPLRDKAYLGDYTDFHPGGDLYNLCC